MSLIRTTNTKGENVPSKKAKTTGIYEDADGVRHFVKAGFPIADNYTLAEATDSLPRHLREDSPDAKMDAAPENKADKGPEKK